MIKLTEHTYLNGYLLFNKILQYDAMSDAICSKGISNFSNGCQCLHIILVTFDPQSSNQSQDKRIQY